MKTAPELIDEVVKAPSLDEYLDRNPQTLVADDYVQLVARLREQRAAFITAEEKKKAKRAGIVEEEPSE